MANDLPVIVTEYSSSWPALFEAERTRLELALDRAGFRIEHIGSTSVPGLAAKPILDVMVGAAALPLVEGRIAALAELGYEYVPAHERVLPQRRFFARAAESGVGCHVHAVVTGTPFWIEHLAFRDCLRANPELAARYGALKRELAVRHRDDREAYTNAKAPFIRAVLDGPGAPLAPS